MTAKDYAPVEHAQAKDLLLLHLRSQIEASEQELNTIAQFFADQVADSYRLNQLTLGPDDLEARHVVNNVFTQFIAFLGIDRAAHRALIFEAGMDRRTYRSCSMNMGKGWYSHCMTAAST